MKKGFTAFILVVALSLAVVAASSASSQKQWFTHYNGHGKLVCDKGNNGVTGPFTSKAACEASLDNGGGNDGGGNGGGDVPTGWPGTSGNLSGTASGGCNGEPIILTSQDDENGYGALDFDITPGQTFSQIGLQFDFDVLSGSQAQSEPYFIVRFSDGTQAFVYSVDVNPGEPGDQTYSLTGNTYITRNEAMNEAGTKIVSSVTLAVDNGDLSISVNGVSNDACPAPVVGPATPDTVFLCYSSFQTTPGAWQRDQADALVAAGYWEPSAVLGNIDGAANVGAYHLACNTGLLPTGSFVGDGGSIYGADYNSDANHTAIEQLGFYPIVG